MLIIIKTIINKKMKITIASKNPVKIETTKLGFEKMFKSNDFSFEGGICSF